jgi:hypothetical protein
VVYNAIVHFFWAKGSALKLCLFEDENNGRFGVYNPFVYVNNKNNKFVESFFFGVKVCIYN